MSSGKLIGLVLVALVLLVAGDVLVAHYRNTHPSQTWTTGTGNLAPNGYGQTSHQGTH